MPRYFFHIIDGNEYPDTEGTVLANPDAARAEAIVVSGEMLKDLGGEFWGNGEWQVRVEDEAGNKVCALTFSAVQRFGGSRIDARCLASSSTSVAPRASRTPKASSSPTPA